MSNAKANVISREFRPDFARFTNLAAEEVFRTEANVSRLRESLGVRRARELERDLSISYNGKLDGLVSYDVLMRAALEQARRAGQAGEVPIGAVIALNGEIVAAGRNQPIGAHDPTAHAEVVAIREASRVLGNYRLTGATLCVTIEPCLMCMGAMVHARIGTLVFGAAEPRSGAAGSVIDATTIAGLNHRVQIVSGVLGEECRELIQEFFRARRETP